MRTDLRRSELLLVLAFSALGLVLFALLLARFGGPSVRLDEPLRLTTSVPDAQGLPVRGDVLVRGVRVGRVGGVRREGGRARLDLVLDGEPVDVRRGAFVRIGAKTLLGEPYVDLAPGTGAPLPDRAELPARESVELDEALEALGPAAREDLAATLDDAGEGLSSPEAAAQLSAALGELRGATGELRRLGETLAGQEADVAGAVLAGRQVLGEVAAREDAVRRLVGSGADALEAVQGGDGALRATVDRLPGALRAARTTLQDARPLLREARPVASSLRAAGPDLGNALDALGPVAADLRAVLAGMPALRAAALPVLRAAGPTITALRPAAGQLEPALRNLVPVVGYLNERRRTVAAWFSNTAGLGRNRDTKGHYARFFVNFDPSQGLGLPSSLPTNTYTEPGDATDPQAYTPGAFPRLTPAPVPPPPGG